MLSRVASALYWMSRYFERADNVARFIDVNIHLMLDLGLGKEATQWEPLIWASGDNKNFHERYLQADENNVVRFLTFDKDNPNAIISCIEKARENAHTVREVISREMWTQINDLHHMVQMHSRKRRVDDLQEFYAAIRNAAHLFTGHKEDTMSYDQGWHFIHMGKLLERADKTARLLDVKYFSLLPNMEYVGSPYDAIEWSAVLKSVNAFEMYLKRFHSVDYRSVAQFLIFDSHFPRAISYCISTAAHSLLTILTTLQIDVPAQHEMAKLRSMLQQTNIDEVLTSGLHEFIDVLQFNLNIVDGAINQSFFTLQEITP